jgi:hypothetical protein
LKLNNKECVRFTLSFAPLQGKMLFQYPVNFMRKQDRETFYKKAGKSTERF